MTFVLAPAGRAGDHFRHGAKFFRWRLDKKPASCTMEQVRHSGDMKKADDERQKA